MSPTMSRRRLSAPMRRGVVALCVAMAFVLSGCGAVIGTTLKVNDDGSGSRGLTVTFTNDDSDQAKQVFAKPLSVYDVSIKKHVPSQLTYNGLHMQGKSMVASFQLDFSSPQDYLTKVRAIIGGSKDPTSDIQNINTPLVNGVVGKENFTSRDLLEWLPQGLEQDGIVDSGNVGNVLDSENNMTLTIGGKNFTSQTPLDVEHVADNGFDQVVVQLNFKSMKDVGAVVWYFSEQAWGADKKNKVKAFLDQATKDGNGEAADAKSDDLPEDVRQQLSSTYPVGKKVTIKAGSLEEVDKRVAQALGNKSGSLKIAPGQAKQSDPSSGTTASFVIPLSLTGQVSCSAICSRDAGDPVTVVTHPSQWVNEDSSAPSDEGQTSTQIIRGDAPLTLDVPLETKKTSTTMHLNPGAEVSYEANLTFDNAALGDNKEEVKKLLRGDRNWSVEQKSGKGTTQYTVRGSADDPLAFSKKYSGSDSPLVVENELEPTTFKNHWMIAVTPLDRMSRGEIRIITDHGTFDDGSSEKTWTPGESTVFNARVSTLRTGPVVVAVVIGVLIVAVAVLAYIKRDAIRAWHKKRAEAARQQAAQNGQYRVPAQGQTAQNQQWSSRPGAPVPPPPGGYPPDHSGAGQWTENDLR